MFFPVSGIEVHPLIPPAVAFCLSFLGSMGGISGAFMLLPFQMSFLGYTNPSVSATNQLFNIVAIPSGVYRYWKEGRLVLPLVWIVVISTLPGVFIGAIVRVLYLPKSDHFKLFAAAVLLYIGAKMVFDMCKKNTHSPVHEKTLHDIEKNTRLHNDNQAYTASEIISFTWQRLIFRFYDAHYSVPVWRIFFLSFVVGIVGGIYGIGGGAIIAPFFVTFFKIPIYIVAGATLMGTFVTSIAGVLFYQAIAPFYPQLSIAPDWLLGFLFGVGGALGMYLGARCQKFIPAKIIKCILCVGILFTACKYIADFLG